MPRKKNARPALDDQPINPADYIALAAPDAPDLDFDAHQAREQRHCCDCGALWVRRRGGDSCGRIWRA